MPRIVEITPTIKIAKKADSRVSSERNQDNLSPRPVSPTRDSMIPIQAMMLPMLREYLPPKINA